MLGTLRLILAIAVAVSHVNLQIAGLTPGVIAVVGFYLISGYVMTGLMRRHYTDGAHALAFYKDRAYRLLPQYFFYAGLTLLWLLATQAHTPFLSRSPTLHDLLHNLLVLPLNYYMFNASDQFTLIPPAWSLGAEMQFYLFAPFVLLWSKRLLSVGLLALLVYLAALVGLIHSEWFGYRLLPGVLLFFLLGAWLQRLHQQRQYRNAMGFVVAVITFAAMALSLLHYSGKLHQPFNLETLLGLMLGLTLLHLLALRPRTWWDDLAGDISYGVFLNHFLILWIVFPQGVSTVQVPGLVALSIALSWLSQRFIERPLLKQRYRLRGPRLVN